MTWIIEIVNTEYVYPFSSIIQVFNDHSKVYFGEIQESRLSFDK